MPLHNNRQDSGPETITMDDSHGAAVKSMLPMVIAVSLRYNATSGNWEYNLHDLTGWHDCPNQTLYEPPISVRRVLLRDESHDYRRIVYDLSGNGEEARSSTTKDRYQMGIDSFLQTNELHPLHITRVYLDADDALLASYYVFHG
jgi:hypothetical protein